MYVDGTRHCGSIRYEAEVDPARVAICHCIGCQSLSGWTFQTVVKTQEGAFKLLSGLPKVYAKTANNTSKREQNFYPDCGSPIYSAPIGEGNKILFLRVGTIRERDWFAPRYQ